MSAALAYSEPQATPRRASEAPHQHRHVEIVTTRAQRRARPRSFYAVVAVGSVFALFLAQLMLSIVLSDGAYQISSLQSDQKQLARTEQALSEQLDLLASPQSLATRAESLGMVVGTNLPATLTLSTGALSGTPTAAAGVAGALGSDGGLVPNSLLAPLEPEVTTDPATPGAPSNAMANAPVASTVSAGGASTAAGTAPTSGQLPSPQTR